MSADWAPTLANASDRVTARSARALHDLLDRQDTAPADGDRLPILWHWLAFAPQARQSDIGQDGHPVTGGFLPPTSGRRRMYAGGNVAVSGDVRIGEPLERDSQVTEVTEKRGKSGSLLFVTVDHEILAPQGAVLDRNDVVYTDPRPRDAAAAAVPTAAAVSSLDDAEWEWGRTAIIDPVVLFRFSALTYNAHRIHYDRRYATDVEGYPGLVVHGTLQAILLADLAHRTFADLTLTSFAFRSTAPAFEGPLSLRGRRHLSTAALEFATFADDGTKTMSATATLATLATRNEELQ